MNQLNRMVSSSLFTLNAKRKAGVNTSHRIFKGILCQSSAPSPFPEYQSSPDMDGQRRSPRLSNHPRMRLYMNRLRHQRASIRALLQLLNNWAMDRTIAVSTFDSSRSCRLAVIRSALQIIQLLVILADEIGIVGAAL